MSLFVGDAETSIDSKVFKTEEGDNKAKQRTDFFISEHQPSVFKNMQQWQYVEEFLREFGSIYSNDDLIKNGIYVNKKHYPYLLSKIMARIADSCGENGDLKYVGYQSRLFVESAISLFAPDEGWDDNTKMVGQQISYLRREYRDFSDFMPFLTWSENINIISIGDVHVHAKGGVTRDNVAFLLDNIFLIAAYAHANLVRQCPVDAQRTLKVMKSAFPLLLESVQHRGGLLPDDIDNLDFNDISNAEYNWAGQLRLRAQEEKLAALNRRQEKMQANLSSIDLWAKQEIAKIKQAAQMKEAEV